MVNFVNTQIIPYFVSFCNLYYIVVYVGQMDTELARLVRLVLRNVVTEDLARNPTIPVIPDLKGGNLIISEGWRYWRG
ncbi:hypothetical protein JYK00_06355 [Thermosipho ferrireducens]|uniref:Uncharacterized protein n=1 Tax=Thermosipho ferrireducens TaxID=2571116 RepID=A0ABX7S6I5_9BACT|nr:hypothetical protein [Thermosipho ferrireducens]QTA37360.1 hypothetical protein JYK00_06355 [Thermosipho ferrireducens]